MDPCRCLGSGFAPLVIDVVRRDYVHVLGLARYHVHDLGRGAVCSLAPLELLKCSIVIAGQVSVGAERVFAVEELLEAALVVVVADDIGGADLHLLVGQTHCIRAVLSVWAELHGMLPGGPQLIGLLEDVGRHEDDAHKVCGRVRACRRVSLSWIQRRLRWDSHDSDLALVRDLGLGLGALSLF